MWTELNLYVMSLFTRLQIKREEGQALVEYTLILSLISIVAITVLTKIGADIVTKLGDVEAAL